MSWHTPLTAPARQRLQALLAPLQQAYAQLPPNDQRALRILGLFVLAFVLGGGAWWAHLAATKAEKNAAEQRELLLWMQAQAPRLHAQEPNVQSLADMVQQSASQQGLIISQTGSDESVQVSTNHASFAVLGQWLGRLAEQGVQVKQLEIRQQADNKLQLQATLVRPS